MSSSLPYLCSLRSILYIYMCLPNSPSKSACCVRFHWLYSVHLDCFYLCPCISLYLCIVMYVSCSYVVRILHVCTCISAWVSVYFAPPSFSSSFILSISFSLSSFLSVSFHFNSVFLSFHSSHSFICCYQSTNQWIRQQVHFLGFPIHQQFSRARSLSTAILTDCYLPLSPTRLWLRQSTSYHRQYFQTN